MEMRDSVSIVNTFIVVTIRYDTIAEFNVDSNAEYTA